MAWHPSQNFLSLFHTEFAMYGHEDYTGDVYGTICDYKIVNRSTKNKSWQSGSAETTTNYRRIADGVVGSMRTDLTMREQHSTSAFDLTVYRVVSSPDSLAHQLKHVKSSVENVRPNITVLTAQFALSLPVEKARTVVEVSRRLQTSTVVEGILRDEQHFSSWSQVVGAVIRLQNRAALPRSVPSPAIPIRGGSPEAQVGLYGSDSHLQAIPDWFRDRNGFVAASAPYFNPNACNTLSGTHM